MPIKLPPLNAKPNTTGHQAVPGGFLCFVYGATGTIANISAVRTRNGAAVGFELYFLDDGDHITCKTANGLSGQSFSGGVVRWGTVYDDDGPPDPGRTITKEEWLFECLEKMAKRLAEPS